METVSFSAQIGRFRPRRRPRNSKRLGRTNRAFSRWFLPSVALSLCCQVVTESWGFDLVSLKIQA